MTVLCLSIYTIEQDGAEPSPNSISALNLFKLGMITGSQDFTDKSKMIISAFKGMLNKFPAALCKLCEAYMDHIKPPPQVCQPGIAFTS